jgi:hypothetical protein
VPVLRTSTTTWNEVKIVLDFQARMSWRTVSSLPAGSGVGLGVGTAVGVGIGVVEGAAEPDVLEGWGEGDAQLARRTSTRAAAVR